MFHLHFSKSLLAISVSGLSFATLSTTVIANDTLTLPETVVTASRVETPLRDVIADVTVIDAEELSIHRGQTLIDVLKNQSGLQWNQDGNTGATSSIFIRGNRAQSTLLIVDGIRMGSISSGNAPFEALPVDQIERVEVLRGSSATSLYGSDAIGGVIQVFTKSSTQRKNTLNATIGFGTENTELLSGGFNVGNKQTRFGMNAAYRKTDGISATNSAGGFRYEPDTDGSDNTSFSAGFSHSFNDDMSVGVNALSAKSVTQYDAGAANQISRNTHKVDNLALWTKYNIADALDLKLQYGVTNDKSDSVSTFSSQFDSKQKLATVQGDFKLPLGIASFAVENLKQSLDSSYTFASTNRDTDSLQLGYQFDTDMLQGQFNVRRDDVEGFSNEDTYSVGLAVAPVEGIRIGGSYATGFRAPTFNDLYFPFNANPNLVPETSKNAEVFFAVDTGNITSRVTGYRNRINNLIQLDKSFTPQNTPKSTLKGVSWRSDWKKDNMLAGFHYDYLEAKNTLTNKQLRLRAKHTGGVYAGVNVQNKVKVRGELDYVGNRYNDGDNTVDLGAYTLFNVAVTTKLSPYVDANLRWNNVFGETYETTRGFNTLGSNALLSLNFHNQ